MSEKNTSNSGAISTTGHVALPFNEDQFKDFITSLLGKPQTITKNFFGWFEIDKVKIINIHQLLDQRIVQQNDARLIQFRTTVYYDDNSTVTLSGFDHLVHFNENSPLVAMAVHMTWQYLIKFRDKENYEKQEVNLSFTTSSDFPTSSSEYSVRYHRPHVNIMISHTARTWGADIEGLLSKHLNTIVKPEKNYQYYIRYNEENVRDLISGLILTTTVLFAFTKTISLLKNDKIDAIGWMHHYFGYVFLLLGLYILSRFVGFLIEEIHVSQRPSFILLTDQSSTNKEEKLKEYKNNWRKYFWTITSSIILGVIGNYIYDYLNR